MRTPPARSRVLRRRARSRRPNPRDPRNSSSSTPRRREENFQETARARQAARSLGPLIPACRSAGRSRLAPFHRCLAGRAHRLRPRALARPVVASTIAKERRRFGIAHLPDIRTQRNLRIREEHSRWIRWSSSWRKAWKRRRSCGQHRFNQRLKRELDAFARLFVWSGHLFDALPPSSASRSAAIPQSSVKSHLFNATTNGVVPRIFSASC